MLKQGVVSVTALILVVLISGCARRKQPLVVAQPHAQWNRASTPFRAANVTAVENTFWACGANESIASSSDGGKTWTLAHENRGGGTLLNILFVDSKAGHASGKGGRLLSTVDGGTTWQSHNVGQPVWMFSFADANNGIAVIGGSREIPIEQWGDSPLMQGPVKLTHDGGEHWEDIPALDSDQLRPFNFVLGVAALDAMHYLMIRQQPEVADIFVVTSDGGRTWKVVSQRDDATNRELPAWVFAHGGEYWAFGMELVHREKAGGYGVPLTLHSRDGEAWTHGANGGLHEYGGCNPQGCYLWDGTVETLYGDKQQYWAFPQNGSLSFSRWAIAAGSYACTVTSELECGSATITEQPQPRPQLITPYAFVPPDLRRWEK